MTTQVYYRKWRPSSFSSLVGQEHVSTTLRNAIVQGRISHSYLFCGPRGTGKTTTARVMAKAVNCLDPRDGDPCDACHLCTAANEGRLLDIIELDAASNRGIDEIRDIRDKVNFAPVEASRKIYIIDEAHMLTDQASNAFLKTLEEPPGHVIFILCTTEAQKILPTIVSRCQRHDFRRLPGEVVFQRLHEIAEAEGVTVDPEALRTVARFSAGSLRDAENLLEQLVLSGGGSVTQPQVEELLGLGRADRWLDLARALLTGDTPAALEAVNTAAWDGVDLRQLHRQTLDLLRAAMLLEWGSRERLDLPDHLLGQLRELVNQLPQWRVLQAVKIWGDVSMRYDAPSTLPLELAAVEICSQEAPAPRQAPPPRNAPTAGPPSGQDRPRAAAPAGRGMPAGPGPMPPDSPGGAMPAGPEDDLRSRWQGAVKALGRCKGREFNLGALLRDCLSENVSIENGTLVLPFRNGSNLERMQKEMEDPNSRRMVSEAIEKFFGQPHQFNLTLLQDNGTAGPGRASQNSPLVRAAINMGGRIVEEQSE